MLLSNPVRFRRVAAGLCLIVAPLLLLLSDLMQTRDPGLSVEGLLDAVAARPGANELSVGLAVYGFALMVPVICLRN